MRKPWSAVGATTMVIAMLAIAAPASAFTVRWFDHDVNYFAGLRCGDTDQVTVDLGPKAFDITIVRPSVGTKLTDDSTGQTDATITTIHRSGGRIVFTATGSNDVCAHPDRYSTNGWETKDVHFDVNYETQQQPLYPSACNNPSYRPHQVTVDCGNSIFYIDHIRWSKWEQSGASGIGTAHVQTCTHACANPHVRSYPGVAIQLGTLRYCGANQDFEYTHLQYRYTRTRPSGAAVSGSGRRGCAVE
jgi:hypothetical protein